VIRRSAEPPFGDLAYELDVLRALDERGWPVPRPLSDLVDVSGSAWCVFRWLPGSPRRVEDEASQRERGRLLARLHDDLDELTAMGQRAGCRTADEIVQDPALHAALAGYDCFFPEDAHLLRWHAERARELFDEHGVAGARRTVLHSDLAPWNLLYADGQLTGVLDFDATHLNFAVADFALSWRGKHDADIHGYHEVRPLDDLDRHLLTPVFWGWLVLRVADDVGAIVAGTAPPTRMEWTISKLPLRTPAMGPEATPYRRLT
jgi:Ser/Thr protein kinase RdoA (MazF antagonist)